jgi:iron complex outermembrane recepter protein
MSKVRSGPSSVCQPHAVAVAIALMGVLQPGTAWSQEDANAKPASPTVLDAVIVNAVRQKATVTRQDAELRDLPQAVTIIQQQQLEERAITRIEDIAYSTVNLQPVAPFLGGLSLGFYTRGFNGSSVLIDGYNAGVVSSNSQNVYDLVSIERIEVLRGPASVLFGQGNPGGVINLSFKRPTNEFGFAGEAQFDQFGQRRLTADLNTPLSDTLLLRTMASVEDSEEFREFSQTKRNFVMPAFRWAPTQDTTIDAAYGLGRYKFRADRGYGYAVEKLVRFMPVRQSLVDPWLGLTEFESDTLRIEAEHRLDKDWAITAAWFDNRQRIPINPLIQYSSSEDLNDSIIDRSYRVAFGDQNYQNDRTASLRLKGALTFFDTKHQLLIGADSVKARYGYFANQGEVSSIDFRNPVRSSGPIRPADTFEFSGNAGSETTAFYVNDLVSIGDQWKIQLGLRYDRLKTDSLYSDESGDYFDFQELSKTTPSFGVVYQPTLTTSIYASYTTSFVPQLGADRLGVSLRPEKGTSVELGAKQELFDRRVFVTAAVFNIEKSDVVTIDAEDTDFLKNGGTARSRGFEVEFGGRPTPGWEVRGGVGMADAEWTQSNDFVVGSRLVGAPRFTGALGFTYRPQAEGWLGDTWFAPNLAYASEREWNPNGSAYKLPAYTRLDLAAGWSEGNWELQLNLKNATDERIVLANGFGVAASDTPRAFGVTVRYRMGSL